MDSSDVIVSSLDYPNIKYFLLPNIISKTKITSGSLLLHLNTIRNSNNEETNEKCDIILEPYLLNVVEQIRRDKILLIKERLRKRSLEIELRISFFYSSCEAIPSDSLIKHLPPNCEHWVKLLNNLPSMKRLIKYIHRLPDSLIETLYWLIVGFRLPRLLIVDKIDDKWAIDENGNFKYERPHFICRLVGNLSKNEITISGLIKRTEYGFLPVNNSDVFSLLFNWRTTGKDRCFNDKFYHAYNYAKLQPIWPKSSFGKWMKIILVIEYFLHPSISYVGDLPGTTLSLSLDLPSENPPGFYHISNTDYARISHILIYKSDNTYLYTIKGALKQVYGSYISLFYCLFGALIVANILKRFGLNTF